MKSSSSSSVLLLCATVLIAIGVAADDDVERMPLLVDDNMTPIQKKCTFIPPTPHIKEEKSKRQETRVKRQADTTVCLKPFFLQFEIDNT